MAKVLLFGRLADIAAWRERDVRSDSLAALKAILSAEDPALGQALAGIGVQAAVDKAIVRGDVSLSPASEVAFLPPMSGG